MCKACFTRTAPEWLLEAPKGTLDEFLEALQEQEAEEERFVWPLRLDDETENEANLTNLDPFFGGLFEDIDRSDLSDVLEGLSGIQCIEGTRTGLAKRR